MVAEGGGGLPTSVNMYLKCNFNNPHSSLLQISPIKLELFIENTSIQSKSLILHINPTHILPTYLTYL